MGKEERLDQWWNGLTDEEKRAAKKEPIDPATRRSLKAAGLIDKEDEPLPSDVDSYLLKMRH